MKLLKICFLVWFALIGFLGAKEQKAVDDTQIGLRKVGLLNDDLKIKAIDWKKQPAGLSKKIDRSFENAPPLIPHDIEGLVPITKDYISCLDCHLPSVAKEVHATPIPKTHLIDFRTGKDLNGRVSEERFNCTQCHVPQANARPLVGNSFKPDFRYKDGRHKTNLIDTLNQGVN